MISIHALLAESDICILGKAFFTAEISIHALLAESDGFGLARLVACARFLSTLSLRRATGISSIINNVINNFYPRSPCGERRIKAVVYHYKDMISIHALLAESDSAN